MKIATAFAVAALIAFVAWIVAGSQATGGLYDACESAGGVLVKSRSGAWVCVKTIEVKP